MSNNNRIRVVEVRTGLIGPAGRNGIDGVQPFSEVSTGIWSTDNDIQITGSLTISGSSTFRNIGPTILSGSVSVSGSITADYFIGNGSQLINLPIESSINALNAVTASFIVSSSFNSFTQSVQTRLDVIESDYITNNDLIMHTASAVAGGLQYYIPIWNGSSSLSTSSIYQNGRFTALYYTGSPEDPLNPELLYVHGVGTSTYNLISAHSELDNYVQINVKNYSSGEAASGDIVITADSGDETVDFIDMGINSSGYTNTGFVGSARDAYVYSTGENLLIGNATPGKQVIIFNGGTDATANAKMFIHDTNVGVIGINTDTIGDINNPAALRILPPNANTFNMIEAEADVNGFIQSTFTNTSAGPSASSDLVVRNDLGETFAYYIDMGINSSTYDQEYVGGANDTYIIGAGQHMHIGNIGHTPGTDASLYLYTGGTTDDYTRIYISASGEVGINTLMPEYQFDVSGSGRFTDGLIISGSVVSNNGFTGSLLGNASSALSASYALTASYALNTVPIDTSLFVSTASFNDFSSSIYQFTSSIQSTVNVLIAATASYVVNSSTSSFAVTGSNTFTGDQLITGDIQVTGSGTGNYGIISKVMFASGASVNTDGSNIDITAGPEGWSELGSNNGQNYVWVDNNGVYLVTSWTGNIFTDAWRIVTGSHKMTAAGDLDMNGYYITSSLFGTSSWANNSLTASYIDPTFISASAASYGFGTGTGIESDPIFTAWTGSANSQFAGTASYATFALTTAGTVTNALTASYVNTLNQNVSINGNLSVFGTASYSYVSASTLNVGTNTISVNVAEPAQRFGGLVVYDSGSISHQATASFLWDSTNNKWIYQNASGSTYSGGMLIAGPRNLGALGDEQGTTNNALMKGQGGDHITSSRIFDDGTTVYTTSDVQITGSLTVTGIVYATSSWSTNSTTASYISPTFISASAAASGFGAGSAIISSNFTASFAASTTWTINHSLNTRYVIVQTFDSSHNQILPQEITLTDANTATAIFASPESGYAVVTVGGAALNYITPAGNSYNVQYNNGGILGGSDLFTFDGTTVEILDAANQSFINSNDRTLYTPSGGEALVFQNDLYMISEVNVYKLLRSSYPENFSGNAIATGDLFNVNAWNAGTYNDYDLVYLESNNAWYTIDQSDVTTARQLLGINLGGRILTEGYITISDRTGDDVPWVDGTLVTGAPVYIKEHDASAPFMSTTVPTTGIVRILGHLMYNNINSNTHLWMMKFRPDHTWVEI